MQKTPTMEEFMTRIEKARKESGVDLSTAEDLSIAVMNLVSLEEHFFFTAVKTKNDQYFETSLQIREMRKKLLAELMPNHEGETWCASKHLLSTTMRLMEVGNKLQSEGLKEKAKNMFERAYKMYSIFWALKIKLIDVKKLSEEGRTSGSFEDLMSKLSNCCEE